MTAYSGRAVRTGGIPVQVSAELDPARRPDVLLRVRRDPGDELSVWWPISAFIVVSAALLLVLSILPTGA